MLGNVQPQIAGVKAYQGVLGNTCPLAKKARLSVRGWHTKRGNVLHAWSIATHTIKAHTMLQVLVIIQTKV